MQIMLQLISAETDTRSASSQRVRLSGYALVTVGVYLEAN